MPETPPMNVKIYDRPERQGPKPIFLVVALVVVVILGFLLFRWLYHPTAPAVQSSVGSLITGAIDSRFSKKEITTFL